MAPCAWNPLTEADITELSALAEANRDELVYMSGPLRPDWYRQGLAQQREGLAVVFAIRLGDRLVGTSRFADFMACPACGGDRLDLAGPR